MRWKAQTRDILTKEPEEDIRASEESAVEDPYFQAYEEDDIPKAMAHQVITHYISVEFKEVDAYPISEEMLMKLEENGDGVPDRITGEDDDL